MATIRELCAALGGLVPQNSVQQALAELAEAYGDDGAFQRVLNRLGGKGAISRDDLIALYNAFLGRNERFPAKASKAHILAKLAKEREIMRNNDWADAVIKAHARQ